MFAAVWSANRAAAEQPESRMTHHISRKATWLALTVAAPALLLAQAGAAEAASTVASWQMDDHGRSMKDSSDNHVNGRLFGGVQTQVTGYSGEGFGFTAPESYVTVSDKSVLDPGTSTWTVSMRVKLDAAPSAAQGTADLLRKGVATTSGGDYKVEILSTGALHCLYRGSSGKVEVIASTNLADGEWHSISCTRTSSSVTATVDGASTSRAGRSGTISNDSAVYLGAKLAGGEDQFVGTLDEVRITKG